jgi:hypothetical protein
VLNGYFLKFFDGYFPIIAEVWNAAASDTLAFVPANEI